MFIIGFIIVSICFYCINKKKKQQYIPINYTIYNNIDVIINDIVNNIDVYSMDEVNSKINDIIALYIDDYFPNRRINNIKLFRELKRKETLRMIKNSLIAKYTKNTLINNNIELNRTIILNKTNDLNNYIKILDEMYNIDIIINN
jgi:hypothetical protein